MQALRLPRGSLLP